MKRQSRGVSVINAKRENERKDEEKKNGEETKDAREREREREISAWICVAALLIRDCSSSILITCF